jgi:hypothetical protein
MQFLMAFGVWINYPSSRKKQVTDAVKFNNLCISGVGITLLYNIVSFLSDESS